jgi:hypothetical protein
MSSICFSRWDSACEDLDAIAAFLEADEDELAQQSGDEVEVVEPASGSGHQGPSEVRRHRPTHIKLFYNLKLIE